MKIRNPQLIQFIGWAGSWVLRFWMGTLRYLYRPLAENVDPHRSGLAGRFIYALWHENILQAIFRYYGLGICLLISRHADGQMIGEVCRRLGFRLVRGSTTRGGIQALLQIIQAGRESHVAITPDGPRGPRRQVQPGIVFMAAQTGLPIIPVGFGYQGPWRMGSWDRLAIPRLFTRATCVTGTPILVPQNATREQLEHYRRLLEDAMFQVTQTAERWADAGKRLGFTDQGRQPARKQLAGAHSRDQAGQEILRHTAS